VIDRLAEAAPDWTYTKQLLFIKYGLQGNKQRALTYATKELETEAKDDCHFAFHLAECYAVIGENEKALDLLEHGIKVFFPYRFLSEDILFANIRSEERFQNLMKEAKQKSEAFEV